MMQQQPSCNRAQRSGQALCRMSLDVGHFKRINGVFGRAAGDVVLGEMALHIKAQLRTSDVIARYRGGEFAVLLTQTEISPGPAIAERIRQTVANVRFAIAGGTDLAVTQSLVAAML
jgi:diguanylate cyclase (GGDEF)-like protein